MLYTSQLRHSWADPNISLRGSSSTIFDVDQKWDDIQCCPISIKSENFRVSSQCGSASDCYYMIQIILCRCQFQWEELYWTSCCRWSITAWRKCSFWTCSAQSKRKEKPNTSDFNFWFDPFGYFTVVTPHTMFRGRFATTGIHSWQLEVDFCYTANKRSRKALLIWVKLVWSYWNKFIVYW